MKSLFFNLAIFVTALNAQDVAKHQAAEGELRIFCEHMEESTGTYWLDDSLIAASGMRWLWLLRGAP